MIYVTPGHEKGIGLEVFLNAYLCLSEYYQKKFSLICESDILKRYLSNCLDFNDDKLEMLKIINPKASNEPLTTRSLLTGLDIISESDILLTLPSSKDQFIFKNALVNGHTEFFRDFYQNNNIGMNFLTNDINVLLLTDHISISEVETAITEELIISKFENSFKSLSKFREIDEVFFSGINPHCGEGGLISSADLVIEKSINKLSKMYPKLNFRGMFAGDTIHFQMKNKNQLFIYAFHDQGLAPFKLKYGLKGINFTSGLPFKRVSVDHGTSFNLYGKKIANYYGMLFLLKEIESWI